MADSRQYSGTAADSESGPVLERDESDGPPEPISRLGVLLIFALSLWMLGSATVCRRVLVLVAMMGIVLALHVGVHYLGSRLLGLTVERVSLFFGGCLVRWRWRETWFALNWFPLGGFVKIKGLDQTDSSSAQADPTSYASVPRPVRVLLLVSAPLAVLGLGVVLLGPQGAWSEVTLAPYRLVGWVQHPRELVKSILAFVDVAPLSQLIGCCAVWMAFTNLIPVPIANGGQALCELLGITRSRRWRGRFELIGMLAILGYMIFGLVRLLKG